MSKELKPTVDYRERAPGSYRAGFMFYWRSCNRTHKLPTPPMYTFCRTAWLVGWLDARSLDRLGPRIVDWVPEYAQLDYHKHLTRLDKGA